MMRRAGRIALVLCAMLYVGCGAKSEAPAPVSRSADVIQPEANRSREDVLAQMKILFPERVSGWRRSGDVALFDETDLYKHINGAAEAFFAYGFQLCGAAEYAPSGGGAEASADDEFIQVDVYDMGRPIQAFGMYTSELYSGSEPVDIGTQGYIESAALNFWKGPYYVKITASGGDIRSVCVELARHIDRQIMWKPERPSMLSLLPDEGLTPGTERFILSDILGYSFLKNGVTGVYQVDGAERTLIITDCGSDDEARDALSQFRRYEEKSGEGMTEITDLGDGGFIVSERYYKRLLVVCHGRYLLVTMPVTDELSARELIRKAIDNIGG